MKILLTGGSSFSGYWFARTLAARGHQVVAPLLGMPDVYSTGVRAYRVCHLSEFADVVWGCRFGDRRFFDLVGGDKWDLLCHHAAHVEGYRSLDFDILGAVAQNTRSIREILKKMEGLRAVVLTGSVFECDEGIGSQPIRAFSPYGLSKGLTWQIFRYWCEVSQVALAKFVIPNPFGPAEEPRFGAYLMTQFIEGLTADVRTPLYVRDNIHIDLLADRYADCVVAASHLTGVCRFSPSGYIESQGAFALRVAREIGGRLGRECIVNFDEHTDFSEPMVRINSEPACIASPSWDERGAWDHYLEFYLRRKEGGSAS